MKAITEIDGDTAVVLPLITTERERLAAHLLAAAGPGNGRAVRTRSIRGGGRAFVVPLAVAYAAGLIPEEVEDHSDDATRAADSKPVPAKKAPAKKAPAKKAAPGLKETTTDVE